MSINLNRPRSRSQCDSRPELRLAVGLGELHEDVLRCLPVLVLPGPRLERRALQRAAVREGQAPGRVGVLFLCYFICNIPMASVVVGAWVVCMYVYMYVCMYVCVCVCVSMGRTWSCKRLSVASSSPMPPERKWIPGTAGGMVRFITCWLVWWMWCTVHGRKRSGQVSHRLPLSFPDSLFPFSPPPQSLISRPTTPFSACASSTHAP